MREVYVVLAGNKEHYWEHEGEFDVAIAERALPDVIRDPLRIHQDKKPSCLVFVGEYNPRYFLIACIKCLPEELWLQTLYICEKHNFLKRKWVKASCIYVREG